MATLSKAWFNSATSFLAWVGLFALPIGYGFSFWHWQQNLDVDTALQVPVVEQPLATSKPNYEQLAMLFGTARVEPVAAPVKESTLSLKLVASYVGGKKGRSAAVIASNENNHKLYYQGDKLMLGVELVTVQARRVLIKRNGVLESVTLEENQNARQQPTTMTALAVRPSVPPPAEPISQQKLTEKLNKLKALASGEI